MSRGAAAARKVGRATNQVDTPAGRQFTFVSNAAAEDPESAKKLVDAAKQGGGMLLCEATPAEAQIARAAGLKKIPGLYVQPSIEPGQKPVQGLRLFSSNESMARANLTDMMEGLYGVYADVNGAQVKDFLANFNASLPRLLSDRIHFS